MVIIYDSLSWSWNILQQTLFSSGVVYTMHLYRHFLPEGEPNLGPFTALRRVRDGPPQLHPPTPYNWTKLDS